ncbi:MULTISPECIES: helix-turn-helix transcriptional regulator [unclassified Saccharicrinis]|uniref:helix-turn-helix transcriptional regulator n=1 Tax=unclassified Saccharicrinis TaxID=2646859 RepID=UPI003D348117
MTVQEISPSLRPYVPIANMIGSSFGQNCEVILHDLSIPQNSVVYVVNGHVTGREIGEPFDHLLSIVLSSKNFKDDYLSNYETTTEDGRKIKASTAFIRDRKNFVIGALCINYDISLVDSIQTFINDFKLAPAITESEPKPNSYEGVIETTNQLIKRIIGNADIKSLKRKGKISLIQFMEQKGVFLIKGSIDTVAELMNISKVTVYSYLDEVKKEKAKV